MGYEHGYHESRGSSMVQNRSTQSIILSFLLLLAYQQILCNQSICWRIQANPHNPGFFSYFNAVLGILDAYDTQQASTKNIEVDCGTSGWYYQEDTGPNWWGYYFEPITPSQYNTDRIRIFDSPKEFSVFTHQGHTMDRRRAHYLISKYIHVRPAIINKVRFFIRKYLYEKFVIGVHYRATDKWSEAPIVPYETMVRHIQTTIKKFKTKDLVIFVATDDAAFIEYLENAIKTPIVYTNAQRSTGQTGVHMTTTGSPYQKGEDALIDCLLLAHSNILLRTASNLSTTALQFNPDLPYIYIRAQS